MTRYALRSAKISKSLDNYGQFLQLALLSCKKMPGKRFDRNHISYYIWYCCCSLKLQQQHHEWCGQMTFFSRHDRHDPWWIPKKTDLPFLKQRWKRKTRHLHVMPGFKAMFLFPHQKTGTTDATTDATFTMTKTHLNSHEKIILMHLDGPMKKKTPMTNIISKERCNTNKAWRHKHDWYARGTIDTMVKTPWSKNSWWIAISYRSSRRKLNFMLAGWPSPWPWHNILWW